MTDIIPGEIDTLRLVVLSASDVENKSVCEITESKVNIDNPTRTLYDPRMGVVEKSEVCRTCKCKGNTCPGHYGHINLSEPVLHPMFLSRITEYLKCICFNCQKILVDEPTMQLNRLMGSSTKIGGELRFKRIQEYVDSNRLCCHCGKEHPVCKVNDGVIVKSMENKHIKRTEVLPMTTQEIINIFDNLDIDQLRLLGHDPNFVNPSNFVITKLLVLPIRARPGSFVHGNYCDDELTGKYSLILSQNSIIKKAIENPTKIKPDRLESARRNLKFHIATLFCNKGLAKENNTGKPMSGIVDRLSGKTGHIRGCVYGKRCGNSARTPISPGPWYEHDIVSVPRYMANIMTIAERVNNRNMKFLENLIVTGRAKAILPPDKSKRVMLEYDMRGTVVCPGDKIKRGDRIIEVEKHGQYKLKPGDYLEMTTGEVKGPEQIIMPKTQYDLSDRIGWFVERNMLDGDRVLFNRQPTLHKAGMQGMRVKLTNASTLQFNLALCSGLNADFDGDEMNIHLAGSLTSRVELDLLVSAEQTIMSPQNSGTFCSLVQDAIIGAYKMTMGWVYITEDQLFQIAMTLKIDDPIGRIKQIARVLSEKLGETIRHVGSKTRSEYLKNGEKYKSNKLYSGKSVISLLLPPDFSINIKTDADPEESVVKIYKGVLYEGCLNKKALGKGGSSIVPTLYTLYNSTVAMEFINNMQFATNAWNLIYGFSIGLGDCTMDPSKIDPIQAKKQIYDTLNRHFLEADIIANTTRDPSVREARITAALNKAGDLGKKLAKDSLSANNGIKEAVESGAKGSMFNIAQITGGVGQQNLKGQRPTPCLNYGKRSLYHYPPESEITDTTQKYESRGFVSSSFLRGLTPREYFFHAMAGREGVCDTALNTAVTGYTQRKMVKLTENVSVQEDGSVRDISGNILSLNYNTTNIDPARATKVNGKLQPFNIQLVVNKLHARKNVRKNPDKNSDSSKKSKEKTSSDSSSLSDSSSNSQQNFFKNSSSSSSVDLTMTRNELVAIIGARAEQLSNDSPSTILDLSSDIIDPIKIAKMELKQRKLPIKIQRTYPNGDTKEISVREFRYLPHF